MINELRVLHELAQYLRKKTLKYRQLGNEIEPEQNIAWETNPQQKRAAVMMRKIGENGGKIGDGVMGHKGKYDS